jgi:hypothetical protein
MKHYFRGSSIGKRLRNAICICTKIIIIIIIIIITPSFRQNGLENSDVTHHSNVRRDIEKLIIAFI